MGEKVFILKFMDCGNEDYEVFENRADLLRYFRQNLMDCMKDGVEALVKELDEDEIVDFGDGTIYTISTGYINRKAKEKKEEETEGKGPLTVTLRGTSHFTLSQSWNMMDFASGDDGFNTADEVAEIAKWCGREYAKETERFIKACVENGLKWVEMYGKGWCALEGSVITFHMKGDFHAPVDAADIERVVKAGGFEDGECKVVNE